MIFVISPVHAGVSQAFKVIDGVFLNLHEKFGHKLRRTRQLLKRFDVVAYKRSGVITKL